MDDESPGRSVGVRKERWLIISPSELIIIQNAVPNNFYYFFFLLKYTCISPYPSITSQENGVALDVAVDDTLHVQVGQSSQHWQTHCSNLLLIHPGRKKHTHTHKNVTKEITQITLNFHMFHVYVSKYQLLFWYFTCTYFLSSLFFYPFSYLCLFLFDVFPVLGDN